MDKILTIFDPLPPLGGQIWTFLTPFSYVNLDMVDICQPLPLMPKSSYSFRSNTLLNFAQFTLKFYNRHHTNNGESD